MEFTAGGRAYDYSINAETGEVLEMSVRDEAAPADAPQTDAPVSGTATAPASGSSHAASASVQAAPNTNASAGKVDEARAKKTALSRVSGATEKDIYEWKLDYDDGRAEYEGKIIYGGMEYEFTINAATGVVTEWDAESVYD